MRFTYQTGAQPLAGYTIQRGIHRGGFGEVYFAHSAGGKEVALKLLHSQDQDVEIRGVTQCLNLKHPNLVNIFDLKSDEHGDNWVIMEYVTGSSLEDILSSFPNGLPLAEVRDWLSGLVAGVAHLHDRGIVHRDLKPANVYRENGIVKVGDVGLSKRLDSDRRNAHTQSVGTVYYMAPEVARGLYGPEVDVYSLGVMLYEMITGKLPFTGETTAEILMKHLTAQPDLTLIPRSIRPALARALEKDPQKRTPTVRRLKEDFFRENGDSNEPEDIPESAFLPQVSRGSGNNSRRHVTSWAEMRANRSNERQLGRDERRTARDNGRPAGGFRVNPPLPVKPVPLRVSLPYWLGRAFSEKNRMSTFAIAIVSMLFVFGANPFSELVQVVPRAWFGLLLVAIAFKIASVDSAKRTSPETVQSINPVGPRESGNPPPTRPAAAPQPVFTNRPTATPRRNTARPAAPLVRPWNTRFPELLRSMGQSAAIASIISLGIFFTLKGFDYSSPIPSSEHAVLFAATAVVGSWLVLIGHAGSAGTSWTKRQKWLARLAAGALVGTFAYQLNEFLLVNIPGSAFTAPSAFSSLGTYSLAQSDGDPSWLGYSCFFSAWLGFRRWSRDMDPHRKRRHSVWLTLSSVAVGYAASVVFRFPQTYAMLWAGTISTTVQLACDWSPNRPDLERS